MLSDLWTTQAFKSLCPRFVLGCPLHIMIHKTWWTPLVLGGHDAHLSETVGVKVGTTFGEGRMTIFISVLVALQTTSYWSAPKGQGQSEHSLMFNVCASLPHLVGTVKSNHRIRGSARVPAPSLHSPPPRCQPSDPSHPMPTRSAFYFPLATRNVAQASACIVIGSLYSCNCEGASAGLVLDGT